MTDDFELTPNGAYIELAKRAYMPYEILKKCPCCGWILRRDLSEHCLSYPSIGEPYTIDLKCEHDPDDYDVEGCGQTFSVNVVIDLRFAEDNGDD